MEESLAGLNPVPVKELDQMQFSVNDISEAIKELDPYSSTPDGDIVATLFLGLNKYQIIHNYYKYKLEE